MSDQQQKNTVANAPAKKLKRPVEEVRAELMASEDVQEQARLLKIPVEQYVEKILDYATHPEKPIQLQMLPDETLKARDPGIPTVAELQTHIEKMISGEIVISPAHQRDGFSGDQKKERYQSALGSADSLKGQTVESSSSSTTAQELSRKNPSFKP